MKKLLWTGVVVGMLACSSENKQDKKNIVESTQSDTQQKIEKVFLQKEKVPHKSELIESFPVLRQLESISVEDRKVLEDLLEIKTNFVMARDHRPHLIKAVFEAIQTLSEKHTQEDWLQILNRN